jgi:hypothetical protein
VELGPKASSPSSEFVIEDLGCESFEVTDVVDRDDAI